MAQSLANVLLHVIFSTKNRTPFLRDFNLQKDMHAYLTGAFKNLDSPALSVVGAMDHVHVLCQLSRKISIADLVKEAKMESSKWAKTGDRAVASFKWQNGYAVFSVSQSNVAHVRRYIANQEEHHRKKTFQDELRTFLRRHEIEFDERYVWD